MPPTLQTFITFILDRPTGRTKILFTLCLLLETALQQHWEFRGEEGQSESCHLPVLQQITADFPKRYAKKPVNVTA